jgi:hypothetical protein
MIPRPLAAEGSPLSHETICRPFYRTAAQCPWQRQSNEAFDGPSGRSLPKSTDLSVYDQDDLDRISHQINAMPRCSAGSHSVHGLLQSVCCCTDRLNQSTIVDASNIRRCRCI